MQVKFSGSFVWKLIFCAKFIMIMTLLTLTKRSHALKICRNETIFLLQLSIVGLRNEIFINFSIYAPQNNYILATSQYWIILCIWIFAPLTSSFPNSADVLSFKWRRDQLHDPTLIYSRTLVQQKTWPLKRPHTHSFFLLYS